MTLPIGWTESKPGGMAACGDPIYGGIVDSQVMDGSWFIVFNDADLGPIEGLVSREEAFATFHDKLHTAIAERMGKLAGLVGTPMQAVSGCLFEKLVEDGGRSDAAHSVARAKTEAMRHQSFEEQIKTALDGGVSPEGLAKAIWGEQATWANVRASYDRTEQELESIWREAGYEIISTGGGFWAAVTTVQGVNFFLTDYAESRTPNPDYALHVGGYSAKTGDYLNFSVDVDHLQDAKSKLPGWAASLESELKDAQHESAAPMKSTGPRL